MDKRFSIPNAQNITIFCSRVLRFKAMLQSEILQNFICRNENAATKFDRKASII
ncbi:hypothetical protein M7I_2244 [Glarea lozoyensis 74030]|uniref:Uncharacterized protein n=1 Tax=Glarea lozoyensis (strain ATCC 74030 / MF5533) TaxID=1104152 RepID=H0EI92_GLAL7|nr:hypothetical protein M7I_2244 [Glarea lozoyensis 74030]